MEGPFYKSFSWQMGDKFYFMFFLVGEGEGLFYIGVNDKIMPRVGEFHKYIFQ